jgi:hypothetical protein
MANSEKEKIRGRLYIIDKPTNIYGTNNNKHHKEEFGLNKIQQHFEVRLLSLFH